MSFLINSLGMKDSWGPLKALAVASVVNGIGDIVLCAFLGYGIAGAAWATLVSQVRKILIPHTDGFSYAYSIFLQFRALFFVVALLTLFLGYRRLYDD